MKPISHDSLAAVLEQMPDPWWLVDPETSRFLLTSPAAIDQLGYSDDEILRIDLADISRSFPSHALWHDLVSPLERGQTQRLLSELRCKSGYLVPVELTFTRIALGDTDALLVFSRDLSEVAAIEPRLKEQEQLLRKLSAQVPGVIYQLQYGADGSAKFVYTSDAARAVFGFEPASPRHPTELAALVAQLHPEDRTTFIEALERSRLALTPLHHEFRIVHHSGSVEWLETRATPERHRDGGTLWHGFTALVTGRKSVELELRRSQDLWDMAAIATGLGIVQLDDDAGSLTLDHRATLMHLLPSSPSSRLTLSDWLALIHPDDRFPLAAEVRKARELQEPLVVRYRLRQPGPVATVLELSAHRVEHERSRVVEIVGTCRDVTGQVSAETLRRDKEAAQRASRSKSEFLSRVSHELRTPLNGILGFAQLMSLDTENPLTHVQRQRLKTLREAGGQLLGLINDMLDVARIEHESFSVECVPVDVAAVARTCVAAVAPLAAASGIALSEVGRQARIAMAEARSLEQVLTHLLSNAVKYNRPQGHVSLTIATAGRHLQIVVADDGPGMTPEQQTRLFQPFDRLGAERRAIPGTGLGLVIARELTRAMGGDLSVRSGPGATGTTCTVTLPTAGDTRARRHVLYIEDEDVNILLMEEVFRLRPHWALTIARDGADGLRQAAEQRPDLVLIDMNLPDMNGIQVITALRAGSATRHLSCIALSADAMREQVDAALRAGFDEYWTKPIDVQRVLRELSRAIAADYRLQPQS
ncbi:MAG TPA: ATP-binding protein [Burkholderiaceae bacterium]